MTIKLTANLLFGLIPAFFLLAPAANAQVSFELNDTPGHWYRNAAGPVAGSSSLAVGTPGVEVNFIGESNTVHTMTSLIHPTGAANMPFDTDPQKGAAGVTLTTPGLYVFFCQIHPYMMGAVVVDDPTTEGLDLGESVTLINGITVPTSSDLATRLLRGFLF